MVRLVRRAVSRSAAPDICAGLVTPCRYCGLLQASVAAHEQARRLDSNVRTSVLHTRIAAGDYLRGLAEAGSGAAGAEWVAMAMAGHPSAARQCRRDAESARAAKMPAVAQVMDAWGLSIEGHGSPEALCSATEASFNMPADLDGRFYFVAGLARFGGEIGAHRAVEALSDLVSRGFFPYTTLLTHQWLDVLRDRSDFVSMLQHAKDRCDRARAAFLEAGGETLLGAGTGSSAVV